MWPNLEGKGKQQMPTPDTEMLGLSDKDFKVTIISMLSKIKESMFVMNEKIGHLI